LVLSFSCSAWVNPQVAPYNSHATPIVFQENIEKKTIEVPFQEGKILEYHPIKPHVPLLMLKRAKSFPFLCCQNTPEAECFPYS